MPPMLLSYVLRLVPSALAQGQLAGTVQVVDSGQTTAFASLEELVEALLPTQVESTDGVTIDLRDAQRLRSVAERPD